MAEAVAAGAREAGADVAVKRVPELVPEGSLERQATSWTKPPRSLTRCADVGPTPGMSCISREPATRSRGFSAKRMDCISEQRDAPERPSGQRIAVGCLHDRPSLATFNGDNPRETP